MINQADLCSAAAIRRLKEALSAAANRTSRRVGGPDGNQTDQRYLRSRLIY